MLVQSSRWPPLASAAVACLALLYRHAPNRTPARWKWVAPGATLATLIWTMGSVSLGIHVENFGRFNRTYGTIGGAVVLSLWMYMSALAILLGAELSHRSRSWNRSPVPQAGALARRERAARAAYMQYVSRQRREQRSQRIGSRDVVLFQNHARRFGAHDEGRGPGGLLDSRIFACVRPRSRKMSWDVPVLET